MKVTLFAFTSRLRFPLAQSLASSNTLLGPCFKTGRTVRFYKLKKSQTGPKIISLGLGKLQPKNPSRRWSTKVQLYLRNPATEFNAQWLTQLTADPYSQATSTTSPYSQAFQRDMSILTQLYDSPSAVSHTFHSLFRVLFNFPSRYLFTIGLAFIISFWRSISPTSSCTFKQLYSLD